LISPSAVLPSATIFIMGFFILVQKVTGFLT